MPFDVASVDELLLGANAKVSEVTRLKWNYEGQKQESKLMILFDLLFNLFSSNFEILIWLRSCLYLSIFIHFSCQNYSLTIGHQLVLHNQWPFLPFM